MELSKIARIISMAAALFSLSNGQEKQLENYVKNNMYIWKNEMKRESEIEEYIKAEASRITNGS